MVELALAKKEQQRNAATYGLFGVYAADWSAPFSGKTKKGGWVGDDSVWNSLLPGAKNVFGFSIF